MTKGVLAIDLGTSMVKAVLVSPTGEVLNHSQAPVPASNLDGVDTAGLWELVAKVIQDLLAKSGGANSVEAVIATGQGDGLWMLDTDGNPSPEAFLWNSNMGTQRISEWEDSGAILRHFRATGTVLWPGTQAALWSWLSESRPDLTKSISTVFCAKDFVSYMLCDEIATDITDASIPFLKPGTYQYGQPEIQALGCSSISKLLAPVRKPGEVLGAVSESAALSTGLAAGTPVHVGALDVVAMLWGSGLRQEGDVLAILGTTALTASVTKNSSWEGNPVGATISLPERGQSLRAMGSSAGTATLEWFLGLNDLVGETRHERFWELVGLSPNSDELFLPYLSGERAPFLAPQASGVFLGLTTESTIGSMGRAVVEGITMAMCLGMDYALAENNPSDSLIVLAGGGSLSPQWAQIVANVSGRTVVVDGRAHLGALGVAGLVIGETGEIATTKEISLRTFSPDEHHDKMQSRYASFQEAINAVSPLWRKAAPERNQLHE
jgi:sugar (pentulose or hexulose) kinase